MAAIRRAARRRAHVGGVSAEEGDVDEDNRYILTFTATPTVNNVNDGEWYYPGVVTKFGSEEPVYLWFESTRYPTREEALFFAGQYAAREVARFQNVVEAFKSDFLRRQLERD